MDAFEKIKRSWWVIFPFTLFLPGLGFVYIGLKSDNKKWILEGITYELPTFFYILASAVYSFQVMAHYYFVLIVLAALIAFIRSIMVAFKLLDVYDKNDSPVIQVGTGGTINKDKDSDWPVCCGCLIVIFIIFAVISIL